MRPVKELLEILRMSSGVRVTVVGDIMLDRFWWGSVDRISPEAPVPVVTLDRMTEAAGGAANVAANVVGLGATVRLIGLVGDDPEAEALSNVLRSSGIDCESLISQAGHATTVKTRIIAHGQQVVRLDQERRISPDFSAAESVDEWLENADVVIVSDYAKGFLTTDMLSRLITTARRLNVPVLVDPKGKEYGKYSGATIITPNRKEALDACKLEDVDEAVIQTAGVELLESVGCDAVLITQGDRGMSLFQGEVRTDFPARARKVYDVTGAGDTVIATFATSIGAGADFLAAAELANFAAGLVVERIGTTAIRADELEVALVEGVKA